MKIAVVQTCPRLLDLKSNLEETITRIHQCKEQGAELIVFPELALTGYFVGERYHEVSLRMDSLEIGQLAAATKDTAALIGFIEESPSMNFYNSALVAVDGKPLFSYRKLNLPNYGVFEERKIFSPGKRIRVLRYKGFTIAIYICNDLWHPSLPYLGVCQKADVFVSLINSSKDSMSEEFSNVVNWNIINTFYSRVFGIYNVCANRVGEECSLQSQTEPPAPVCLPDSEPDISGGRKTYHFWGGSEVVNPYGQVVAKALLDEEDAIYADLERNILRQKRIILPYLRNDDPYFTFRELERILFDKKNQGPIA